MDNQELQRRATTYNLAILTSRVLGILDEPDSIDEQKEKIIDLAIEFLDRLISGKQYVAGSVASFQPKQIENIDIYSFVIDQLQSITQDIGSLPFFISSFEPGKSILIEIREHKDVTATPDFKNTKSLFKKLAEIYENQIKWVHANPGHHLIPQINEIGNG